MMPMTDSWSNFFLAIGGAAAALTGLLFIAVSGTARDSRVEPHVGKNTLGVLLIRRYNSCFAARPGGYGFSVD
jgi:hypothetical protein